MKTEIFRRVAMEKMASPDQLDKLLTVTYPRSWLALVAAGGLVIAAILWGIFGSIPVVVNGHGILLKNGGVFNIVHGAGGQITDISVAVGDIVQRGQIIARVEQPELIAQINNLQNELAMLSKGRNGNEITVVQLEGKIRMLRNKLEQDAWVVSPYTGRILEAKVKKWDAVKPGTAFVSLEQTGEETERMEAVVYIPAERRQNLSSGMEVQIAPAAVSKEGYGYMLGQVTSVSEYPATVEGMIRILGNKELAEKLSGNTAAIEVHVDLIPDSGTESGYRWTTPAGPPMKIGSGTLCSGSIVVKRIRPISWIMP